MNTEELSERIRTRATHFNLEVPATIVDGCAAYLALLARWNRRINLTALPLDAPIPDATVDKLIVEPIVAAPLIPDRSACWLDLGSGGGSPALPLRLCYQRGELVMVEARERKCAFLREAVRLLELNNTTVIGSRFEALTQTMPVDLVTVRAVKLDESIVEQVASWLRPGGVVMAFGTALSYGAFSEFASKELPDGSALRLYSRR